MYGKETEIYRYLIELSNHRTEVIEETGSESKNINWEKQKKKTGYLWTILQNGKENFDKTGTGTRDLRLNAQL